jgi:hypothetical protein
MMFWIWLGLSASAVKTMRREWDTVNNSDFHLNNISIKHKLSTIHKIKNPLQ